MKALFILPSEAFVRLKLKFSRVFDKCTRTKTSLVRAKMFFISLKDDFIRTKMFFIRVKDIFVRPKDDFAWLKIELIRPNDSCARLKMSFIGTNEENVPIKLIFIRAFFFRLPMNASSGPPFLGQDRLR